MKATVEQMTALMADMAARGEIVDSGRRYKGQIVYISRAQAEIERKAKKWLS